MDSLSPFTGNSLIELLEYRASVQANERAYLHLKDEKGHTEEVSYSQLRTRVLSLAAELQKMNVAGQRVIIAYPSGLEYLIAYLGVICAGAVAVPVFEPRQSMHSARLEAIIRDARPTLLLTNEQTASLSGSELSCQTEKFGLKSVLTDVDRARLSAEDWQSIALGSADVVFLQYTSGSTGNPKGVKVSNGNLIHNLGVIRELTEPDRNSCQVTWLPPYHDMGLIGGLLQPLFAGYPCVILSPVSVIQRPYKFLQAISQYDATIAGGPNFIYETCVRRVRDSQLEGLDLSSWRVAFNGAEPIHAATLAAFSRRFAEYGFDAQAHYPCYGLAENTLMVTGSWVGRGALVKSYDPVQLQQGIAAERAMSDGRELVSSGRPAQEITIKIVDPETCLPRAEGEVGEIWTRSKSVPEGYWQREPVPGEEFFGTLEGDNQNRYLRTGDLGFIDDGELFVTGRIKDLIIIRGKNHYPQDIELTLTESHPELKPHTAAAFSIDTEGGEALACVVELKPNVDEQSRKVVEEAIRDAISREHELQVTAVHFIRPGSLPKTSSGKIQRSQAKRLYLEASNEEGAVFARGLEQLDHHRLAADIEARLGDPNDDNSLMSYARVMELDEREAFQEEFFQHLLAMRLHHYYVPAALGGMLTSYEQLYVIGKVLARRDLSTAVTMSTMVWSTLAWIGGSSEQKNRCADLTLSIRGAQCLAYSEEHHGSDLLANQFRATRVPGGFLLQGEKWPINRAARSDVVMLLARTSDDPGSRSLSLFMVEKSAVDYSKFSYLPKVATHGLRGCDICGIKFDGAFVPESALIGEEGKGLELAILAFQVTRTLCVALSVGALENNLRVVMDFALNRQLYRGSVFDIPNARHYLTGAFADLLITDTLGSSLTRALHVIPADFSVLSAVAKFFAPFKLDKAQKDLATVLGARFFFREKHKRGIFQKSLRDSQVVGLFDGSSEVNLYSLCTQLPLLARRQRKRWAEGQVVSRDSLELIFNPEAKLPTFDGTRLDLSCHGRDLVMEAFPQVLAMLNERKNDGETTALIAGLSESLYTKHRSNLARIEAENSERLDIRSPAMFELAKQYCIVYAGVCAILYWQIGGAKADPFVRRGEWLAVGLKRLLLELRVDDGDIPASYFDALAKELLSRTQVSRTYGIVSTPLPDQCHTKEKMKSE